MPGELGRRIRALVRALGVRRFLLGALVGAIISAIDWARPFLRERSVTFLETVPSWYFALAVVALLCLWWWAGRILELEKAAEPDLQIDPIISDDGLQARLRIENLSTQEIPQGFATLYSIPGAPQEIRDLCPVGLATQHQTGQTRRRGRFYLSGRQPKSVELARLVHDGSTQAIVLQLEYEGYPSRLPVGTYEVTIHAYGNGMRREERFRLSAEDGRLFLARLGEAKPANWKTRIWLWR